MLLEKRQVDLTGGRAANWGSYRKFPTQGRGWMVSSTNGKITDIMKCNGIDEEPSIVSEFPAL